MQATIDFFYTGEIIINMSDVGELWDLATFLDIKSLKDTLSGLLQSIPSQTIEQRLLFDDNSFNDIIKDIQEEIPVQEVEFDLLDSVEPVEFVVPSEQVSMSESTAVNVYENKPLKLATVEQNIVNPGTVLSKHGSIEAGKVRKLAVCSRGINKPKNSDSVVVGRSGVRDVGRKKLPINFISELRVRSLEFQANLEKAVIACKNGKTLEQASNAFKIPRETIWRNVKNFKLPHIKDLEK